MGSRRFKLTLSYDGTTYYGWQRQSREILDINDNTNTVKEAIQSDISDLSDQVENAKEEIESTIESSEVEVKTEIQKSENKVKAEVLQRYIQEENAKGKNLSGGP